MMEEFKTSIFEKTKAKARRRMVSNLTFLTLIIGIWVLFFIGFPLVGLKTAILFSAVVIGTKLYDDKAMGISAYGERKANLTMTEQYLEIRDVRIPYTEMSNLVIYVNEYLGMPREFFGIYHGGNNPIEFEHLGKKVTINYVIKNKPDFDRVSRMVNRIENNPDLKPNLRKLD